MARLTHSMLAKWGERLGFRARSSKNGVLFQRGAGPTVFTIFVDGLDGGLEAELAFHPDHAEGQRLLERLSETFPTARSKGRWQWPRLGATRLDRALLDRIEQALDASSGTAREPRTAPAARNATTTRRSAPEVRAERDAGAAKASPRRKPASMRGLEELGRVRLSPSFFFREFLYSEIAALNGFSNIPDDPALAIEAGRGLCEHLLEPLQAEFGRISIRSAYRSREVNGYGNAHKLNCSSNEHSYGRHIWDGRDARGCLGATACIVVHAFIDYYERSGHWEALAWWIHDHLPYSRMEFYPRFAAFNLTWSEIPERRIASRTPPRLGLIDPQRTEPGREYDEWLASLR